MSRNIHPSAELRTLRSGFVYSRTRTQFTERPVSVTFVEEDYPVVDTRRRANVAGLSLQVHWIDVHGRSIAMAAVLRGHEGPVAMAIAGQRSSEPVVQYEMLPLSGRLCLHLGGDLHPLEFTLGIAESLKFSALSIAADQVPVFGDDAVRKRWLDTAADMALSQRVRLRYLPSRALDQVESATQRSANLPGSQLFISANPNATGSVGHFVGFDTRLSAALPKQIDFASIGNRSLEKSLAPPWMIPAFSKPTSPSHSLSRSPLAAEFVASQYTVMLEVLRDLTRFYNSIHVFWYMGCAEYVDLVERVSEHFPQVTWHMHLFWDFRLRHESPTDMTRFESLIARAQRLPNLHVSLGSRSQGELLREQFDIEIDHFPAGPSVNLTDRQSYSHLGKDAKGPSRSLAFFPSNHAVGKNWAMGAQAALLLQRRANPVFRKVFVRVIDEQRPPEHAELVDLLREEPAIEVLEGPLTADQLTGRIGECGVVGLPYTPEWFRYRTSALLTESIVQGCRVVCLDETNLAEVVRMTNSGSVIPAAATAEVLAAALETESAHNGSLEVALRRRWFDTTAWAAVAAASTRPSALH